MNYGIEKIMVQIIGLYVSVLLTHLSVEPVSA